MDLEQEQQFIQEMRQYATESLPLGKMEDEELEDRLGEIVQQRLAAKGQYCSIEQKISIVRQV